MAITRLLLNVGYADPVGNVGYAGKQEIPIEFLSRADYGAIFQTTVTVRNRSNVKVYAVALEDKTHVPMILSSNCYVYYREFIIFRSLASFTLFCNDYLKNVRKFVFLTPVPLSIQEFISERTTLTPLRSVCMRNIYPLVKIERA